MSEPSLRRTLLVWLVPPLSVVLLLGSVVSCEYADRAAVRAFDQSLIDAAIGLGRRVQMQGNTAIVDIPIAADQIIRADQFNEIFYVIRAPDGRVMAGDSDLGSPPPAAGMRDPTVTVDSFFRGQPVRIAAVRVPCGSLHCTVMVGETMIRRTQERNRTLLITFVPEAILMVVALAFVWIGVKRGIAPLARLSTEIRTRSPTDLRPFDSTAVPSEARPIVTELNSLFARVNAATAHQNRFTANAAHQLRTPLAVLRTHVELALLQPASADLKELLQHAHAATIRGSRLTHQLLTLARTEPSGQAVSNGENIDLRRVAEALANELVYSAMERRVDLGFELESAPIVGDAFMLSEALTNVVMNAIQYGDEGGRVTVRTGVAVGDSFIEVDDDGPGIPISERERVLERFYRVAGSPGLGSGLGLAIVREIVLGHRGTLTLLDGASGRGCRVRMAFPVALDSAPPMRTRCADVRE